MFNSIIAFINDFSLAHPFLSLLLSSFIIITVVTKMLGFLDRHYKQALTIASEKVKERLQNVEPMNLDLYLQQTAVPVEYYESAKKLLTTLGEELFYTPPEKLTFKNSFRSMLCVPISALHLNTKQLQACQSHKIDIFYVDNSRLTYPLTSFYDYDEFSEIWENNENLPKNEDDLVDFILEMNPEEFLCCFALFDPSHPAESKALKP